MSPRTPLPQKVGGGHDPPAPMGAPPLLGLYLNAVWVNSIQCCGVYKYYMHLNTKSTQKVFGQSS